MKIVNANIVTAFDESTIGSKVINPVGFRFYLAQAISEFDFAAQPVAGQGFMHLHPSATETVSAGVGVSSTNPENYVLRNHRGVVLPFLKRQFAAKVSGVACVVYTLDAYMADPDVRNDPVECERVKGATHVLVAVLAFAGPKAPALGTHRLVHNLSGGNRAALLWTADEIRAKALEAKTYDDAWSTVAD